MHPEFTSSNSALLSKPLLDPPLICFTMLLHLCEPKPAVDIGALGHRDIWGLRHVERARDSCGASLGLTVV